VTGVMSSKEAGGYDPGAGVLLEHVELLRDRPPPRIADSTVLGVFKNATAKPLSIELIARSEGGEIFFLGPQEVSETDIWEGRAVASELKGPEGVPLHKREVGKPVACAEITFRNLPRDYQYSPEESDKRKLYFRISTHRIELVPASEAKHWRDSEARSH
jgi:hypothetical protein